jgi:SAM-dependent methyltransferase
MNFKDNFSIQAVDYAKHRPSYPRELFQYLASIAPGFERAWDCATGNGLAAGGLADFFSKVIATDASQSQVDNASAHQGVEYRVSTAEETTIEPASIDLVTVAQALHWLDLDRFYREVQRVLRPSGVLAVWCYNLLKISPEADKALLTFYRDTVGEYWPPERHIVEDSYRSLVFPFAELNPPQFHMEAMWSLPDLLGYVRTWSATQRFITARGVDPVPAIGEELSAFWGKPEREKRVKWPLQVRVGIFQGPTLALD